MCSLGVKASAESQDSGTPFKRKHHTDLSITDAFLKPNIECVMGSPSNQCEEMFKVVGLFFLSADVFVCLPYFASLSSLTIERMT